MRIASILTAMLTYLILGGCNRNANSTAESGNTVETDLSLSTDADGSFSDSAMHPYLEALEGKLELRDDGIAYRYFNEDTTRYRFRYPLRWCFTDFMDLWKKAKPLKSIRNQGFAFRV